MQLLVKSLSRPESGLLLKCISYEDIARFKVIDYSLGLGFLKCKRAPQFLLSATGSLYSCQGNCQPGGSLVRQLPLARRNATLPLVGSWSHAACSMFISVHFGDYRLARGMSWRRAAVFLFRLVFFFKKKKA